MQHSTITVSYTHLRKLMWSRNIGLPKIKGWIYSKEYYGTICCVNVCKRSHGVETKWSDGGEVDQA